MVTVPNPVFKVTAFLKKTNIGKLARLKDNVTIAQWSIPIREKIIRFDSIRFDNLIKLTLVH